MKDNNINFSENIKILLDDCIEQILFPLENSLPICLCGHYYGGIYMQILTPLQDANNSKFSIIEFSNLSRRVAKAIYNCYQFYKSEKLYNEIKEIMYKDYIISTQLLIWESVVNDIIWNEFYA